MDVPPGAFSDICTANSEEAEPVQMPIVTRALTHRTNNRLRVGQVRRLDVLRHDRYADDSRNGYFEPSFGIRHK
jgi:hypothetical protein